MPIVRNRHVLTGMKVREAMRKNICQISADAPLKDCIRHMTRTKTNAILLNQLDAKSEQQPVGVISKTDIIAAFYALMNIQTPAQDIMNTPLYCHFNDPVPAILETMNSCGIHRIYVQSDTGLIQGVISFSDIVGQVYRYCRTCMKSGRLPDKIEKNQLPRLVVQDVMTDQVVSCLADDTIGDAVEVLITIQAGAVLVVDEHRYPLGVISKTDVNRAYAHGRALEDPARSIMGHPIVSCAPKDSLADAIQKMFLFDLQRLFVIDPDSKRVQGVLALSDAARFRSGTCAACSASRLME